MNNNMGNTIVPASGNRNAVKPLTNMIATNERKRRMENYLKSLPPTAPRVSGVSYATATRGTRRKNRKDRKSRRANRK